MKFSIACWSTGSRVSNRSLSERGSTFSAGLLVFFRRLIVPVDFLGGSCRLASLQTSIATKRVRNGVVHAEDGATRADERSGCWREKERSPGSPTVYDPSYLR
jgi:hypothetical protein